MNKKEYITPALLITALSVERMLALSTNDNSADEKYGQDTKKQGDYDVWDE